MKKLVILLISLILFLPANHAKADDVKQGDIITFGSYEQDNNLENGAEPIEWIVLSVEKGKALLLAKYGLDFKPYYDWEDFAEKFPRKEDYSFDWDNIKITWEDSTLRTWLNEEFYNTAFTVDQKRAVLEAPIENVDNPYYGTEGGNDTNDRVFLLSLTDIVNMDYGFSDDIDEFDVMRRCAATPYAKAQGVETLDEFDWWEEYTTADGKPTCSWWLRTPGAYAYSVTGVGVLGDGFMRRDGKLVYDGDAVRPAIYISINSGTNTSTETENSTKIDGVHSPDENAAETNLLATGDADGDGSITSKDVTVLRRYLAGGWDVDVYYMDSDVDCDGYITSKDVTLLRRYLAGGWGIVSNITPYSEPDPAEDAKVISEEGFDFVELEDGTVVICDYTSEVSECVIPSKLGGRTVSYISAQAFYNRDYVEKIVIPETVRGLYDLEFARDLGAFYFPKALKEFEVSENNPYLKDIDGVLYSRDGKILYVYPLGKDDDEIIIPEGVEEIYCLGESRKLSKLIIPGSAKRLYAWTLCESNIDSVFLSEGVKVLYNYVFSSCYIGKLYIPSSVTRFSMYSVSGRPNVYVDESNKYYKTIEGSLCSYDGKKLYIASSPDYSKALEDRVFRIPDGVEEVYSMPGYSIVYIPASVSHISGDCFWDQGTISISSIVVSKDNPNFCVKDDTLYSRDMKKMIRYFGDSSRTEYIVPYGVEELDGRALCGYKKLERILLPETVKSLNGFSLAWTNARLQILGNVFIECNALWSVGENTVIECKEGALEYEWGENEDEAKIPKEYLTSQRIDEYNKEIKFYTESVLADDEVLTKNGIERLEPGSKIETSVSYPVVINDTSFPDDTFRSYVSEHFDLDKNGELSLDEADKVTILEDIQCEDIKNLQGIGYFKKLSKLCCSNNQLKWLDLTGNPELIELDCSYNELVRLAVRGNEKLKYINCENNCLKTLTLIDNKGLEKLDCGWNKLQELDLSGNTALKELYCVANELESLSLGNNTALLRLDCSENKLEELNCSANKLLVFLHCRQNMLSSLKLDSNPALESLDCGLNMLKKLDISNLTVLKELNCESIGLKELDLSNNTALTSLDCSGYDYWGLEYEENELEKLDVSNNVNLEMLKCCSNRLSKIDISNNSSLKKLICSDNPLEELDLSMALDLDELECVSDGLSELDVSHNTKLKKIDCRYNSLTVLDISSNLLLESLDCEKNKLADLDLSKNTNLSYLCCSSNPLTSLDLKNNSRLYELKCSSNGLTSLDVSSNTNLTALTCSLNDLTEIDLSNNPLLDWLYCDFNDLTSLDLSNNPELYILNCVQNKFKTLDLSKNTRLSEEYLRISSNVEVIWPEIGND